MARQSHPSYDYQPAFEPPMVSSDQPEMSEPLISDHPMVQFGRNLLAPLQNVQPYEVPLVGGALRGADFLQRSTIDAGAGLFGIGLQKGAEMLGGGRGREEQAVTSAVTAETDKIENPFLRAVATPYLYAAAASEAKRIAQHQAELPAVEAGPLRVDLLDVAELGLPGTGLIGAASKASKGVRLVTRGAPTPKGEIGTLFDAAQKAGATPEQAFAAASDKFGLDATRAFFETGNDIFIAPPHVATDAAAQLAAAGGRESTDQIERAAQQIGEAPQRIEQGTRADGFRPSEVGPVMGSGTPRQNPGVNLDKIDAPAETKDYIRQVADENAGFIEQRRGVVTIAETEEAARRIAVDAAKYAYLKPGTALNAEQLSAVGNAMVSKGNEVTRLQDLLRQEAVSGVTTKENRLRLLAAVAEHQSLQRTYAGARAESGRALRIQREIASGLKTGEVNSTYARAEQILGGKDVSDEIIARLQAIWTDPKLNAAGREQATFRFIQNFDRATTTEKVYEFWLNAILSGPTTHIVNITGQTLLQVADITAKLGSAAVEAVSTVGGLRRTRERYFSEAFASVMGLGDGFRRIRHELAQADGAAMNKFRETGDLHTRALKGSSGRILNLPTTVLGAEDVAFKALGKSRALWETAANIAAKEGKSLVNGDFARRVSELRANPTDEMLSAAEEGAKRASLQIEGGKSTKAVMALRDRVSFDTPLGEFKPIRYVIPFVRTPINLVKIGAEYSPYGFVQAVTRSGGERSDSIARAILGSTAMGLFAQQYALGSLTGPIPSDPAERDAFYAAGKLPYAVKIGDKWVSYQRLEPVSTPLKWTAALMETAKRNDGQPVEVIAEKMVFALSRTLADATYMEGLSDLVDAIQDPERNGAKFLSGIAGGFNPALFRNIVRSQDPYIRDPKGIVQQIEATLPFLNEGVPIRETNYGEPATRSEGRQGLAGLISPVDFNTERRDPVTERLLGYKLPESFDANGVARPARALLVGEVGQDIARYRLSDDEGRRYQRYAGQSSYNLLDKLFKDELPHDGKKFSTLPYEDQVRAIRKTVADARENGRAQVADEIIRGAKEPTQVARGAAMRWSTLGTQRDKVRFIEGLQKQGLLSGEVRTQLDRNRGKADSTVAEYVRAAPLVTQYLQTKPYLIGNPDEWKALAEARKLVSAYAKANPRPAGMADWQWAYRANPGAANLVRKYSYAHFRNPKRADLLRRYPFIEKYVS